jgi:hypothetical protein
MPVLYHMLRQYSRAIFAMLNQSAFYIVTVAIFR